MAETRIVVTGMGIFTSLGKGVEANHNALINHQCGISHISILETKHQVSLPAGEIKLTNTELKNHNRFTPDQKIPRSVLLSIPAIEEALEESGLITEREIDFYYSTTVGGIDISEDLLKEKEAGKEINHNDFQYHDCGASTDLLVDYFKLEGNTFTISTACSSSANAIGRAAESLKQGKVKYALAG